MNSLDRAKRHSYDEEYDKAITILIHIIEKQQKQIEKLQNEIEALNGDTKS